MSNRPNKDEYYLNIAREVCRRGTCLRRQYGSVIVNNDQIVATGYAGPPRGIINCIDIGICLREYLKIAPGQRYEICRSVHAEMNAIIHTNRSHSLNATLYLAGIEVSSGLSTKDPKPCLLCRRVIINAGIKQVVVKPRDSDITYFIVQEWINKENKLLNKNNKVNK